MNISLTEKQKNYIKEQLESGDYQNASELVREALRMHALYRDRVLKELQSEIQKGWNSNTTKNTATDIARKKLREKRKV